MTNILFLYNNLVDAATLTASSANANFPVANLKNPLRTKTWKTAGATAGTANVVCNFGSPQSINCIALTGYDWTSAPGTLQVEFNASDSWGAPAVTKILTWAASPTVNGNKAAIILLFDSISYRYARLNVVYSPGGTPLDWNLGRIFIGEAFQPAQHYAHGFRTRLVDPSLSAYSVGNQCYTDEVEKYRIVTMNFAKITEAQWLLFQKMFNTVGKSRPLFIALDYDGSPNEKTIYGQFQDLPEGEDIVTSRQSFGVTFREAC